MAQATKRALQLIKAMRSATFTGISVKELSEQLGVCASNVCRDLADLESEGFAEKRDDGRYQLSTAFLQIAIGYQDSHQRMQDRLNEINQRVYR